MRPGLHSIVAVCTLATLAATPVASQDDVKKKDANPEFFHPLRGDFLKQPGFELFGPRAGEQIFFEPTGVRFHLTPGNPGGRANMGLAMPMTVKGDFEITVNFDMLKEPAAADTGAGGSRFSLGIFKDTTKPCVATISRSVGAKQGPLFVSWWQLWTNAEEPSPKPLSFTSQTKIKAGRLRLVRNGKALIFQVSEGDKEFARIKDNPDFGDENLRLIRLSASTGGERAELEVRVTDLRVRSSEQIPNLPNAAPEVVDVMEPPRSNWLLSIVLASACVAGLGVIGIGAVVVLRRRNKSGKANVGGAAQVQVACSQCHKKLRVRMEDASKKYKCPHCGAVTTKKNVPRNCLAAQSWW